MQSRSNTNDSNASSATLVGNGSGADPKTPSSPLLSTHSTPPDPVEGVAWRRDRIHILAVVTATVTLIVWLAVAGWLIHTKLFLPLDFFGGLEDETGSNGVNGFFAWSNGTYNILITLVGNLTWVLIAAALTVGFSTYLRRLLLHKDGISLYTFDIVVQLSTQSLQFKLRWSAVLTFGVFLIAQLYPSATQAAFGSSIARTNISAPYRLARVSSNLDSLAVNAGLGPFLLPALVDEPGSTLSFLNAGFLTNTSSSVIVGATLESNDAGEALFDTSFLALDTQAALQGNFSRSQRRLLASSPALRVFTTVEGFLANITCALVDVPFTQALDPDGAFSRFSLDFPCASIDAFYSTAPMNPRARTYEANSTADYFACPDGSPTVYVFAVEAVGGTIPFAYECAVTASSALVPIQAAVQRSYTSDDPAAELGSSSVDFTYAEHGAVENSSVVEVPASFGLVKSMGEGPFRTRGMMGHDLLSLSLFLVEQANGTEGRRQFVERVVETAVKLRLVQLSSIALLAAAANTEVEGLRMQIEALKIHLDNLAWLAVPAILLAAVLLIFPLLLTTTGRVDFTDPISSILIALNSPLDSTIHGACTGEFSPQRGRTAARKAGEVRLWYGQHHEGEKDGPEHLVLAANPVTAASLGKPVRRKAYA
ncbi:hypothetical protein JCM6882_009716 [Rhodosporidiobolus microsporus]